MNSATTAQTFAEETTTADIVDRMVHLYPGWENRRTPRRYRFCAQIPPPSSPLEP
ncbi:hypothetical protein [Streptomyces mirabilis]